MPNSKTAKYINRATTVLALVGNSWSVFVLFQKELPFKLLAGFLIVIYVRLLVRQYRNWRRREEELRRLEVVRALISLPNHILTDEEFYEVQVAIAFCWLSAEELVQAFQAIARTNSVSPNISRTIGTTLEDLGMAAQGNPTCRFNSLGTAPIRCAVNPLAASCEGCRDYEAREGDRTPSS